MQKRKPPHRDCSTALILQSKGVDTALLGPRQGGCSWGRTATLPALRTPSEALRQKESLAWEDHGQVFPFLKLQGTRLSDPGHQDAQGPGSPHVKGL